MLSFLDIPLGSQAQTPQIKKTVGRRIGSVEPTLADAGFHRRVVLTPDHYAVQMMADYVSKIRELYRRQVAVSARVWASGETRLSAVDKEIGEIECRANDDISAAKRKRARIV